MLRTGDIVSIQLLNVKQPPYTVTGAYLGTETVMEEFLGCMKVEGQVGDQIGKIVYVPCNLVHTIEVSKRS
jgi:hypothetical protein